MKILLDIVAKNYYYIEQGSKLLLNEIQEKRMEKVNADGLTEEEFLAKYQPGNYKRPSVTVDMMVLRMMQRLEGMEILLIQ